MFDVDAATRRELVERLLEYTTEDAMRSLSGKQVVWGEAVFHSPDRKPGAGTETSPPWMLWFLSTGLSLVDCSRLVPDSWDVSPEEWRLRDV